MPKWSEAILMENLYYTYVYTTEYAQVNCNELVLLYQIFWIVVSFSLFLFSSYLEISWYKCG